MILINHINREIVIYADRLVTGEVVLRSGRGRVICRKAFREQSLIHVSAGSAGKGMIRVTVRTEEEIKEKTFQIQ